jgi:hypothetical protein
MRHQPHGSRVDSQQCCKSPLPARAETRRAATHQPTLLSAPTSVASRSSVMAFLLALGVYAIADGSLALVSALFRHCSATTWLSLARVALARRRHIGMITRRVYDIASPRSTRSRVRV